MGLFDKVVTGLNGIAGDFKNEVSKINGNDIKGKLKDIKEVVSESYGAAVDKLENKKELRVEVDREFMSMRGQLLRDFTEMNLKNRNEIVNKYLRKEIKSFKDLELLPEVIYKGEVYKNPDFKHSLKSENVVFHEIDSDDTEESIEVEVLNNDSKLIEESTVLEVPNDIVKLEEESVEAEHVPGEVKEIIELNKEDVESLSVGDLIEGVTESNKENIESLSVGDLIEDVTESLTIGDLIKVKEESNVPVEKLEKVSESVIDELSLRELDKEKILYEKIIKYIWEDIKKYAELYIFELSIPKKSLDTVSGNCEVCKGNFTYKEMKHKDYMICSDVCLNKIKKVVKDLNSGDVELVLRKHNEKSIKDTSKEEIENMLSNYNLIRLVDIEEKSWELLGNSHVFKSIKSDGSELYVNYNLVCEKDVDGIVKVLLTTDSHDKAEIYNNLIKEFRYENLDLFKFMFI